jgi:hypothetical protein
MLDSKFLINDVDDESYIDSLWSKDHRGHNISKSKGGSNKVENLELEKC